MVHSIANLSWSTKEAEGHEQMDYALEKELIFYTARCIPVPAREETGD
jgi:hypothetical protein